MGDTSNMRTAPSADADTTRRIAHERPVHSTETVCEAVIAAVTTVGGVEMGDLEPLYSVVDTEAVERLVSSKSDARVVFTYEGYRITVDGRSNSVALTRA